MQHVPQPEWPPHVLSGPAASVKRHTEQLQQQQAAAGASEAAAGGPSPCSSSRGVNDGAGGDRDAGATSSGGAVPKPAAGVPKNRRPDSWAPWEDVALGQYKPIQVGPQGFEAAIHNVYYRECSCTGAVKTQISLGWISEGGALRLLVRTCSSADTNMQQVPCWAGLVPGLASRVCCCCNISVEHRR
jgi:hypothetical protein